MLHQFRPPSAALNPYPTSPIVQLHLPQNAKFKKPFKLNHPTFTFQTKPFTSSAIGETHISSSSWPSTDDPQKISDGEWDFKSAEIEEGADEGCPWEGAIMYKRNANISHLEYCSTLERLGLGKLSSDVSKNRASEMGLRVVKSVKDYPNGTPVMISVDVTRKKQKLRLDGIIRTVIALNCNRCGEPAAQSVYSNFSLLLCEEPIQESETIDMGVIFGEGIGTSEEGEDDSLIDLDDRLYFPVEEKVIDISKNIRDLIHVEITITAICDPKCKGLCLSCGSNLNISNCTCRNRKAEGKGSGPLGSLRKQMQQT